MRLDDALADTARHLQEAGLEQPRREARRLVALAAGMDPEQTLAGADRLLTVPALEQLDALLRRRIAGEPFGRLAGRREFWSLSFTLSPETLDPRSDSEALVEAALAAVPDRRAPLRLLDLGTGSGCLLLALLSELPGGFGIGVDKAPGAARTAAANARLLGLGERAAFVAADWTAPLGTLPGRGFDLIVSNPPYIASAEIAALDAAVRQFDPRLALDGGADGLDAFRALAAAVPRLRAQRGTVAIEIGADQAESAAAVLVPALGPSVLHRDLAGRPRVLVFGAGAEKSACIAAPGR